MFLSISKRLFTTWQTYQYFNNQRKLCSNCISFRCFECFPTTRSLPFCKGPRERTKPQQPIKKKQQTNKRANVLYLYSYSWAPATSCHRFETFNANMKALKCKMNTSDATRFRKRKFLWFVWGLWKRRQMSKFISCYVSSLLSEVAWLAISSPDFSIHMDIGQPFANGHASARHDY